MDKRLCDENQDLQEKSPTSILSSLPPTLLPTSPPSLPAEYTGKCPATMSQSALEAASVASNHTNCANFFLALSSAPPPPPHPSFSSFFVPFFRNALPPSSSSSLPPSSSCSRVR